MKLSDLLHRHVRGEDGRDHGVVVEVRLVQDGRPLAGPDRSLRVDGLLVGRRAWAVRLGLTRAGHTGPAILRHPARWLAGDHAYVPWASVIADDGDAITIAGEPTEVPTAEP